MNPLGTHFGMTYSSELYGLQGKQKNQLAVDDKDVPCNFHGQIFDILECA